MPKKKKASKNAKTKSIIAEKRFMVYADPDGQVYGVIDKILGCRFFTVTCFDGKQRRSKVRSKRIRINVGDVVLVSLREFSDGVGDIIYKYSIDEVKLLQKDKHIPMSDLVNLSAGVLGDVEEDDMLCFDFNDI
jgi:translation initiation factor 1A